MAKVDPSVFDFLTAVKNNNNREWFNDHKKQYEVAHEHMIHFADELLFELQKADQIDTVSGKKSLMRIYRDVRFSKDKTPFKVNFGGGFKRATTSLRGGYYYHIEPGNCFVGGGFWGPNKEDLLLLREQIAQDSSGLRTVVDSKEFKNMFGSLLGDQLKTAPKGFPKDHKDIDLLRYKSFIVKKDFNFEESLREDFSEKMVDAFDAMRPFFDVMSEYLTTDLNGESLV